MRSVIGRKTMYAHSTLSQMTKSELIDLLYIADYNYTSLLETYDRVVDVNMQLQQEVDKLEWLVQALGGLPSKGGHNND